MGQGTRCGANLVQTTTHLRKSSPKGVECGSRREGVTFVNLTNTDWGAAPEHVSAEFVEVTPLDREQHRPPIFGVHFLPSRYTFWDPDPSRPARRCAQRPEPKITPTAGRLETFCPQSVHFGKTCHGCRTEAFWETLSTPKSSPRVVSCIKYRFCRPPSTPPMTRP